LINFHNSGYYKLNYDLQKEGKKRTNTANISNLPNNIAKDSIHFEISETLLKFPFGPIISPRPGPTLDIEVAAPEIADKKSSPEIESNIAITRNKNR
tara:strand:+ start:405 stop:695 length:291 start_codon:yes stop_codon:yes gene_type:complete